MIPLPPVFRNFRLSQWLPPLAALLFAVSLTSELKIIFPNVKPGSITHFIVVVEDLVAKIPGEFNQSFSWGGSWATGRQRFLIDLSEKMAGRLQIETLGTGVPQVVKKKTAPGRFSHPLFSTIPSRETVVRSPK